MMHLYWYPSGCAMAYRGSWGRWGNFKKIVKFSKLSKCDENQNCYFFFQKYFLVVVGPFEIVIYIIPNIKKFVMFVGISIIISSFTLDVVKYRRQNLNSWYSCKNKYFVSSKCLKIVLFLTKKCLTSRNEKKFVK
jgi:hypothetical protein